MGGFRRRWPLTGSPLSAALPRWTQPGFIKSLQRNTITIANGAASNTATITGVSLSDSLLLFLGSDYGTDGAVAGQDCESLLTFTNATTITATRVGTTGGLITAFEVIEFMPGVIKSVQRSTIALAGVVSNTATVNPVVMLKSAIGYLGASTTDANAGEFSARTHVYMQLTNATTITATRGNGNNTATIGYQLVEYF